MNEIARKEIRSAAPAAVSLPLSASGSVRLVVPATDDELGAAGPLVRIDRAHGALVALLAGAYAPDGRMLHPIEIVVAADPATVTESSQIPSAAPLAAYDALSVAAVRIATPPGVDWLPDLLDSECRSGALLYCRKRRAVFEARSPRNGSTLHRTAAADERLSNVSPLAREMVLRDARGAADPDAWFYAVDRARESDDWRSFETLLLDQGKVAESDAASGPERPHTCTGCPELRRCYATDDYAYYADRLAVVSAADLPLRLLPFGPWRLDEAAQIIGGRPPSSVASRETDPRALIAWRAAHAAAIESAGPPRLLTGESDGRELIEILRLKLSLVAEALDQLDRAWLALDRPHLCWNAQSIRAHWRPPHPVPAACWGFEASLRKIGWQPLSGHTTASGGSLPYPPAFSDAALLPPEVVEAARYFDEPRACTLFVKRVRPSGPTAQVWFLAESLGIASDLFCPDDAVEISARGKTALCSPGQAEEGDGESVSLTGSIPSESPLAARGEQIAGAELRWRPLFGEAVDLHALGMLALGAMLSSDQRTPEDVFAAISDLRTDLTATLIAAPQEQRERTARAWISERAESDAPAAVLSRRNLWSDADVRASGRLDALAPPLWRAVVLTFLRMVTFIDGFSYCRDRTVRAPRLEGGALLPLAELRGLIALLDDRIFGRVGALDAVRTLIKGEST